MKNYNEFLNEKKSYEIYHSSFTYATAVARKYAEDKGYKVDEDSWWDEVAIGQGKPKNGSTTKAHIKLTKDGKEQKKMLHIQVYDRGDKVGNRYELNCYIN